MTPVPIDPSGVAGPTRRQAASDYWRMTTPGFYVPADTPTDKVEQRILEQSMRLPTAGAVTGWAACRLHGANFCDGLGRDGRTTLPVPLDVGPRGHLATNPEVRLVFRPVPDEDRATRYGIPSVTAERATFDAAFLAPDPTEAVVAIDVMCAAELVSLRMLRHYADAQTFRRHKVDTAIAGASEHSRSPNESRLRRLLVDGLGLTLIPNCPVHDLTARLLGIADLLDVEAGMAIEFHGGDHRLAVRQTKDVQKEEALRRVGLEVTSVTGLELHDTELVLSRIASARSRALFEPPSNRRWVARPPADDLHERITTRRALEASYAVLDAQPLPDIRDLRGY